MNFNILRQLWLFSTKALCHILLRAVNIILAPLPQLTTFAVFGVTLKRCQRTLTRRNKRVFPFAFPRTLKTFHFLFLFAKTLSTRKSLAIFVVKFLMYSPFVFCGSVLTVHCFVFVFCICSRCPPCQVGVAVSLRLVIECKR